MLKQTNVFEACAIIRLTIANDVLNQFSMAHVLSCKCSFPPSCLKCAQSDVAVFIYFPLQIFYRFINKVINVNHV